MKKRAVSVIFLLIFLCVSHFGICALGANVDDQIIKVGILYGGSSTRSINVFHDTGYVFGFYDANDNFTEIIQSDGRFIAVVPDATFKFKDSVLYENQTPDGSLNVGAYHVYSGKSFASYEEGSAYLEQIKASGLPSPFLSYINGQYKVKIDSFSTLEYASSAASKMSVAGDSFSGGGGENNTFTVVDMNTGAILFEYTSDNASNFAVRAKKTEGTESYLKNKNTLYFGDFVFLNASGKLSLINYVTLGDYLRGVLPYEMSSSWPIEALKAQAISARNFALSNLKRHKSDGFSVCTTDHCQVYGGASRKASSTDQAVYETSGLVATYNGDIASLYFHSSSGGYTENVENVWSNKIPYLVAVPSPEDLTKATYGIWTYTVSASELTAHFNSKGYDLGNILDIYVDTFTDAGNVLSVTVVGDKKTQKITKEYARIRLSPYVRSQRFKIYPYGQGLGIYDANGNFLSKAFESMNIITANGTNTLSSSPSVITASGTKALTQQVVGGQNVNSSEKLFVFDGKGWGNNIGMSQNGAKKMAEEGKTASDIILHYFPGVSLEVR